VGAGPIQERWEAKVSMLNKPGSLSQHHLQIRLVSGDRQQPQQQVSVWIKPSEAKGPGGLAVLRYAALLGNKCLAEQCQCL